MVTLIVFSPNSVNGCPNEDRCGTVFRGALLLLARGKSLRTSFLHICEKKWLEAGMNRRVSGAVSLKD